MHWFKMGGIAPPILFVKNNIGASKSETIHLSNKWKA